MIDDALRGRLRRYFLSEGLWDLEWLKTLDEFDEPPMFTRLVQERFLFDAPVAARGPAILELGLEYLDRVVDALGQRPDRQAHACVTLMDWDDVSSGERPVAHLCWLVIPDLRREPLLMLGPPSGGATRSGVAARAWSRTGVRCR